MRIHLLLGLRRGQVAQGGVDPFRVGHVVEESAQVPPGIGDVGLGRRGTTTRVETTATAPELDEVAEPDEL